MEYLNFIRNKNLINKSNNNVYSIDVLVKNLEDLTKLMTNLNKIKYVNDVERIMR